MNEALTLLSIAERLVDVSVTSEAYAACLRELCTLGFCGGEVWAFRNGALERIGVSFEDPTLERAALSSGPTTASMLRRASQTRSVAMATRLPEGAEGMVAPSQAWPLCFDGEVLGALVLFVRASDERDEREASATQSWLERAAGLFARALLRARVREGERNFRDERLEELEKMLEKQTQRLSKANRDLEQFAYVASHDLRAPLRAIDTLSQWLEGDLASILEGESREQMRLLRGRVRRMDRLLVDLLEYARVGRVKVHAEFVDLGDLVREIVDLCQLESRLAIEIPRELPRIFTARFPLKRVLMNLLTNAAKHHDRPKGVLTIQCVSFDDELFKFVIDDDGPGIPLEYHDRVFQMFQTLRPRDANEGSGMGLALVRRIVELTGGQIDLRSGPGRGSTFSFTWPKEWHDIHSSSASMPAVREIASSARLG